MKDSEIGPRLEQLMEEALRLRFEETDAVPGIDAGPARVLEALHALRVRLDRVETIQAATVRIRGRARRESTLARAAADDAWDDALRTNRARPTRAGQDGFVAPRERYADANLDTVAQQQRARRAEALTAHADDAVEVVRLAARGLDSLRQDLLTTIRAMNFQSHLEQATPERGF